MGRPTLSSDRSVRTASTRRRVMGAAALSGAAGCVSTDSKSRQPTTSDRHSPSAGQTVPGSDVLMTTDGETVYAIEDRKRLQDDRATEDGRVIAEGEDTGQVLQAVLDTIEYHGHPPNEPMDDGVPGHHVHFGNGVFPWETQASTGGANGVRITGNWWGTDWSAEAEIESFVDFPSPDEAIGMVPGPQIAYLLVHGNDLAEHFVTLGPATRATYMQSIVCFNTTTSMIYGNAVGDPRGIRFNDQSWFYNLQCGVGGALAILEGGPNGIPAGMHFRDCFCWAPDTYGIVIRNGQRIYVDRFYVGIRTFGDYEPGEGGVLIENPRPEFDNNPPTTQCYLHMVEIESPENPDAYAVHIRAPEGAVTENTNHKVVFPRGSHNEKHLKVEAAEPHRVSEIELQDIQIGTYVPDAIVLKNARDCRINVTNGPADPRRIVTEQNGLRNTVNDVGRSDGHPADGPWGRRPWEGVTVLDTNRQDLYAYVDGTWYLVGRPGDRS